MSNSNFSSLNLGSSMLSNLESLGFKSMTAIQAQSLPPILAGRDVIAQGQTGSGKTVAFGLGLLAAIEVSVFKTQGLVLCPTRELAEQVSAEIRRLARSIANVKIITLYGGTPLKAQVNSLAKGVHIVVGTPGRIEDHINKNTLDLSNMKTLVLDEADRMLDMGFQKTLGNIIDQLPSDRQTLLFSATFPDSIKTIAKKLMQSPITTSVAPTQDTVRVDHHFHLVDNDKHRMTALQLLLLERTYDSAVVFCNTRKDTQIVAGGLKSAGFSATELHGDMEQKDRDQTLIRFTNHSIHVLVATDVAARGLDIASLDLVINYHLPREMDVYTHRIGRTGRAGTKGIACSMYDTSEQFRFDQLAKYLDRQIVASELPPEAILKQAPRRPEMSTLRIDGGKKQKLRAGDIVGALTNGSDINGDQIGKIKVLDNWSYIAIKRELGKTALQKISSGKLKGKSFRARLI